jgi:hypothetical protein
MAWTISCSELSVASKRHASQNFASAPRLRLCPTLGFALRQIDSAFFDALRIKNGRPRPEAVVAAEWIADDTFQPGSFRWACHWLSLDYLAVKGRIACSKRGSDSALRRPSGRTASNSPVLGRGAVSGAEAFALFRERRTASRLVCR